MALKPPPLRSSPQWREGNASVQCVTKAESSGVPPTHTDLFETECGEVPKDAIKTNGGVGG